MTNTEQVLVEMFTENTGRHMMDSGDVYGRSWERNQSAVEEHGAKVFLDKPEVVVNFWDGEVDYVTINTFKWLLNSVEYDNELQERFNQFVADRPDTYWLTDMEDFAAEEGGTEVRTVNTYNYDTMLDEVLQWVGWRDDYGDVVVLLQYHGGADVRGGYTAPRAFRVLDDYPADTRFDVWCTNPAKNFTTDGEEAYVCGLQGSYNGTDGEWYSPHGNLVGDIDLTQIKQNEDSKPLCPGCGDAVLDFEISRY